MNVRFIHRKNPTKWVEMEVPEPLAPTCFIPFSEDIEKIVEDLGVSAAPPETRVAVFNLGRQYWTGWIDGPWIPVYAFKEWRK